MLTSRDLSLGRKCSHMSSSRKFGRGQKRELKGEGEERKQNSCPQTHNFEKLRSPTKAASDWCGAGGVDLTAMDQYMYIMFMCIENLV